MPCRPAAWANVIITIHFISMTDFQKNPGNFTESLSLYRSLLSSTLQVCRGGELCKVGREQKRDISW